MTNETKKQEEKLKILEHLILGNVKEFVDGIDSVVVIAEMKKFIRKEIIKETAEEVCDKMIGEKKGNYHRYIGKKITYEFGLGYNSRIEEEKEIKKQIIKEL